MIPELQRVRTTRAFGTKRQAENHSAKPGSFFCPSASLPSLTASKLLRASALRSAAHPHQHRSRIASRLHAPHAACSLQHRQGHQHPRQARGMGEAARPIWRVRIQLGTEAPQQLGRWARHGAVERRKSLMLWALSSAAYRTACAKPHDSQAQDTASQGNRCTPHWGGERSHPSLSPVERSRTR